MGTRKHCRAQRLHAENRLSIYRSCIVGAAITVKDAREQHIKRQPTSSLGLVRLGGGRLSLRLCLCRAQLVTLELRDRPSGAGRNGYGINCGHSSGRARRRVRLADPFIADDPPQPISALRSHATVFRRPSFYAMPILDWAVILSPSSGYSSSRHPPLRILPPLPPDAMFVVGFTLLFVRLIGRELDSFLMALVLYFSAYVQYWWNGSANFLFLSSPGSCLLLWNMA